MAYLHTTDPKTGHAESCCCPPCRDTRADRLAPCLYGHVGPFRDVGSFKMCRECLRPDYGMGRVDPRERRGWF